MDLYKVFLKMAGKEKMEVGSVALQNPAPSDFEMVELIQGDAESLEDTISVVFLPK